MKSALAMTPTPYAALNMIAMHPSMMDFTRIS